MNTASKHLLVRWTIAILLGLVCSLPALAHEHDGGYWRPHHYYDGYYGWQRPHYTPPPPPIDLRRPPRFLPPPPQVGFGAPPVWREPQPPQYQEWR